MEKYGNVTDSKAGNVKEVPEEIASAMRVFVEAGLLDKDLQPNGISNAEAAYIASYISQRLWQENRWKPFEELWNRKKDALRKKWDDMKDMSRGVEFRKSILERMR